MCYDLFISGGIGAKRQDVECRMPLSLLSGNTTKIKFRSMRTGERRPAAAMTRQNLAGCPAVTPRRLRRRYTGPDGPARHGPPGAAKRRPPAAAAGQNPVPHAVVVLARHPAVSGGQGRTDPTPPPRHRKLEPNARRKPGGPGFLAGTPQQQAGAARLQTDRTIPTAIGYHPGKRS